MVFLSIMLSRVIHAKVKKLIEFFSLEQSVSFLRDLIQLSQLSKSYFPIMSA